MIGGLVMTTPTTTKGLYRAIKELMIIYVTF